MLQRWQVSCSDGTWMELHPCCQSLTLMNQSVYIPSHINTLWLLQVTSQVTYTAHFGVHETTLSHQLFSRIHWQAVSELKFWASMFFFPESGIWMETTLCCWSPQWSSCLYRCCATWVSVSSMGQSEGNNDTPSLSHSIAWLRNHCHSGIAWSWFIPTSSLICNNTL